MNFIQNLPDEFVSFDHKAAARLIPDVSIGALSGVLSEALVSGAFGVALLVSSLSTAALRGILK
jgi:hypothetical protein